MQLCNQQPSILSRNDTEQWSLCEKMLHSEDVLAQSGQYRSFAADPQEDFEIPPNGFLGIRFYHDFLK